MKKNLAAEVEYLTKQIDNLQRELVIYKDVAAEANQVARLAGNDYHYAAKHKGRYANCEEYACKLARKPLVARIAKARGYRKDYKPSRW